ncbi:Myb/SANT-like domain [Sesbania bispinosa]|nr:Myb/SANT-like domain [Sesbania bispinosa]
MDFVMLSQFKKNKTRDIELWFVVAGWLMLTLFNALRSAGVSDVTKQHIKNRMKTCNARFAEAYDLFNSLSGFAWNQMTRMFETEEEVWDDFIRDKTPSCKMEDNTNQTLRPSEGSFLVLIMQRGKRLQLVKPMLMITKIALPMSNLIVQPNEPTPQSTGTSASRGTKRKAPMIDLVEIQMEN